MRCFCDVVDYCFIAEAWRSAGGVGEELPSKASGQLLRLLGIKLLPGRQIGEKLAFGGAATRIYGSALIVLAIGPAPNANRVIVFESEAGWVDGLMATGSAFIVAVLVQLIANARGSADVRLNGWDAGRWWRDGVS